MAKKKVQVVAVKGKSRLYKGLRGCLFIFIGLIVLAAILPGKKPDASVALGVTATTTARPDVRPSPTVIRALNAVPSATITDTPIPIATDTAAPAPTSAPVSSPTALIQPIDASIYYVVGTANVRSCAATSCNKLGQVTNGTQMTVTGITDGEEVTAGNTKWYQVQYGGTLAFIYSTYLTNTAPVQQVQQPVQQQSAIQAPAVSIPNGATAKCNDGSYWYNPEHRGACHGHNGVETFYTP